MTPILAVAWQEVAVNVAWAVTFAFVGGIVGIALVLMASMFLPRLIERLTPNIDEEKEIARGNVAVAEYPQAAHAKISRVFRARPRAKP